MAKSGLPTNILIMHIRIEVEKKISAGFKYCCEVLIRLHPEPLETAADCVELLFAYDSTKGGELRLGEMHYEMDVDGNIYFSAAPSGRLHIAKCSGSKGILIPFVAKWIIQTGNHSVSVRLRGRIPKVVHHVLESFVEFDFQANKGLGRLSLGKTGRHGVAAMLMSCLYIRSLLMRWS